MAFDLSSILKLLGQQQKPPGGQAPMLPQQQDQGSDFQGPTLDMLQPKQEPPRHSPQAPNSFPQMGQYMPQKPGQYSGPGPLKEFDPSTILNVNPFTAVPKALWDVSGPHPGMDERKADMNATLKDFGVAPPFSGPSKYIGGEEEKFALKGVSSQQPPAPQPQKGPAPESLFARLDAERGGSRQELEMAKHQGFGEMTRGVEGDFDSLVKMAAHEAAQGGVDSPDKADQYLRTHFHDDPYLESVLNDAKQRYADAQADSAQKPGILDYLGYSLAMLGGAHPMQASEVISRRGEKKQYEASMLNDLNQAQGAKIHDRQDQRRQAESDYRQMEQAKQLLQREYAKTQQHQTERGQDQNFQRLKSGRGASLQELNQLRQQAQYATNPAEKKALELQIKEKQKRVQFFNRQLGEPDDKDITGMMTPDVARLLGLG